MKFKNKYSTIPLLVDAIVYGIPVYPRKIDKGKWIVEYNLTDLIESKKTEDI